MLTLPPLEYTLGLALRAHAGQVRKDGTPYILHPIRVMLDMPEGQLQHIALLHGYVEDCKECKFAPEICYSNLERNYPHEVVEAIRALTHLRSERYSDYINRVSKNLLSVQVKLADLNDNMNSSRMLVFGPIDADRHEKYIAAYSLLMGVWAAANSVNWTTVNSAPTLVQISPARPPVA